MPGSRGIAIGESLFMRLGSRVHHSIRPAFAGLFQDRGISCPSVSMSHLVSLILTVVIAKKIAWDQFHKKQVVSHKLLL
jgi:hypothetical protein